MPADRETLTRWLRDLNLGEAQTWRLVSGLILFSFALTHFLNHALGHISIQSMEEVQAVRQGNVTPRKPSSRARVSARSIVECRHSSTCRTTSGAT